MTPCPRHRTAFGDEGELEMPLPLPLISTRREYDGGHNMTGGKTIHENIGRTQQRTTNHVIPRSTIIIKNVNNKKSSKNNSNHKINHKIIVKLVEIHYVLLSKVLKVFFILTLLPCEI